jgi:hypothetical protein
VVEEVVEVVEHNLVILEDLVVVEEVLVHHQLVQEILPLLVHHKENLEEALVELVQQLVVEQQKPEELFQVHQKVEMEQELQLIQRLQ